MNIKLIINDSYKDPLSKADQSLFSDILNGYHLDRKIIKDFIADAEILMIASESVMPFDRELIDAAPNLKMVSLDTTDFSWIDVNYAATKNIVVCNSPHVCTEAIAEHAMAFMLNFSKGIHMAYRDLYLKNGQMEKRLNFELQGKTLGIIGLGTIGSQVAALAGCMGMKILGWNRTPKNNSVDLNQLLSESDFITLHLAANEKTKNFINKEKIGLMKESSYVINLADKTLVNNDDMYEALISKRISGYGVELWEMNEANEHPLFKLDNVMAFNGFGWYTKESLDRTFTQWLENITSYLNGKVINQVH